MRFNAFCQWHNSIIGLGDGNLQPIGPGIEGLSLPAQKAKRGLGFLWRDSHPALPAGYEYHNGLARKHDDRSDSAI